MKWRTYIITAFVFFAIGFLIGGWVFKASEFSPVQPSGVSEKKIEVMRVAIDFGGGSFVDVIKEFADGTTAFSILKDMAGERSIALDVDDSYDFGVFVRAIGDKKNGDDKKYWQYWVNGKYAMIASDKYVLKPGDFVEWKFIKQQEFLGD